MSLTALHERLDAGLRFAPEYRGGLSNHLPMALSALHGLGADAARLRDYFDRHVARLEIESRSGGELGDWTLSLGHVDAVVQLFDTFEALVESEGVDAVLQAALPVLMQGVGAAAFHGLIRTAYGVEAGHSGEIAAGLAYWACRHLPLEAAASAPADQHDPGEWIAALAADFGTARIEGGLIFERLAAVARRPAFARHAPRLALGPGTLEALADFAAQRYAASGDFTVLHLVTSCHAMRCLLPRLDEDDRQPALAAYARAYAAGCIASGIDLHAPPRAAGAADWAQLTRQALASNDDHVIKLVFSCREEARHYGDGSRLQAARVGVGSDA